LLDDDDPHFRISVVRALETVGDARARGALRRRLDRELDGRVTRRLREALKGLGQGPSADTKRLSDELEQLRRDLGDLKTRFAKVEGAKKARHKR
jgi:aminopeptidase N